ncbi:MAG: 2-hydroxychromene-2-carboxylate isomerase [Myxococcota bacterium]
MSETIEFFYDYISPATYIAFKRLPELVERHGVSIEYKPVLLGGIHKAVEHKAAITQHPSKLQWMYRDLQRTAKRHDIPFGHNPNFPFLTVGVMRGALVAKERGEIDAFNRAFFDAMWRDGKKLDDMQVIGEVLASVGLDVEAYAQGAQDPRIKELLKTETSAAVERAVFGCPTFIVRGEVVFGQDRIHVVEEILGE